MYTISGKEMGLILFYQWYIMSKKGSLVYGSVTQCYLIPTLSSIYLGVVYSSSHDGSEFWVCA